MIKMLHIRHMFSMAILMFFLVSRGFAQDIDHLVKSRLTQEQKVHGWLASDINDWRITDQYTDKQTGFTYAYVQQRYNKIPVYNAISVFMIKDGQVKYFKEGLVSHLESSVTSEKVVITAEDAIGYSLSHLGEATPSGLTTLSIDREENRYAFDAPGLTRSPVNVQLVYCPTEKGVKLAWNVSMEMKNSHNWWNVRVDALNGEFIDKNNYTVECSFESHDHSAGDCAHVHAPHPDPSPMAPPPPATSSYNVFLLPVEAPTFGARSLATDPYDPIASPYGWHDVNGADGAEYTITRGNNVYAYEDADNNNLPGFSPDGGSSLTFDFPYTFSAPAISNQSASITNLFYTNNRIHDMLYHAGFTEAAGNFQVNNYGNGGLGNDPVNAEAFDGGGTNNANFSTPPDGTSGRMQMYLWTGSGQPDGSFDNGVILHEYGHGVSNRLTGGPSNSGCLSNAEQAGEGWSDWLALISTIEPGDNGAMARGIGTYALSQTTTGPGIRRYPYSTNMTINPQTYANVQGSTIPHGVGEIWCDAIWDMTWFLIEDLGFNPDPTNTTSGNYIALRLVLEGMKLQPCSPGFLDSRDAILLADDNLYGGVHKCRIWEAFARRGMGYNAIQGSSNSINDQVADFTKPLICSEITGPPTAAFVANVTPCTKTVVFTNQSVQPSSFAWDFGDGATSSVQDPQHTYSSTGSYSVTLTVTNSFGTDQVTHVVNLLDLPYPVITGNHSLCPTGSVVLDAGSFSSYIWSTGATTQQITVTSPNIYSVTVTNSNGCQASTSVTTTNLLSTTISGENILCIGGSTILDAGVYAGYLWSDGQTTRTININTPGEYSVTVTDSDGCNGIAGTTVTTTLVAGLSTIQYNPGNVICQGNSTTLTVDTTLLSTNAEQIFSQTGIISISSSGAVNGNPYPSALNVSGLPLSGVTVKSVSLNGVSHTWPDDLDILLQSPTGANVILMSDVGGGNDIVSQNFTFKDGFPALATNSQLVGGTYSPTNFETPDTWDTPGPGSFSQASPTLSLFSGNFNGTWNLLVRDDLNQDGGSISSWSITFGWHRSSITYTWSPSAGLSATTGASTIASPSVTTTYTVTATDDDSGCTNTAEATVTVDAVSPVITGNPIICTGGSTTLSTDLFTSYQWSNGATTQSITVSDESTYTVTVTNAGGCTGISNPVTTSLVTLTPTISGNTDFCEGTSTTLETGIFASYLWSNGQTTQSITVNTADSYSVTVTSADGCTGYSSPVTTTILPASVGGYLSATGNATLPELIYYKFDEPGQMVENLASAPVGSNPAPIVGITAAGGGEFDGALLGSGLTGTTGYVNTGWNTALGTGHWTLSFWINNMVTGPSGINYLLGDVSSSFRSFTGGIAGNGNIILRGPVSDCLITGVGSGPAVVHFVYDGSTVKGYKNGVLATTINNTGVNINGGLFKIGGYSSSAGLNSGGLMDEFRLYNRPLSASEIAATWNLNLISSLVCAGDNSTDMILSGHSGSVVSWQSSTDNWSTFSTIGSTNSTYTATNLVTSTKFRAVVQNGDCDPAYSSEWLIRVEEPAISGTLTGIPPAGSMCPGTQVSATVASGSGGNGTDKLEYRTKTAGTWSAWVSYSSGSSLVTTGMDSVQIRTWRDASACSVGASTAIGWDLTAPTVSGIVTGGTAVCYLANSTLLTASGYNGTISHWQSSTDGSIWTDIANTSDTYTALNISQSTWFRTIITCGTNPETPSSSTLITVNGSFQISGNVKYYNNPKTPLDGLKITLKQGGTPIGSPVITGSSGSYSFSGITNGTYDIEVSSAHPGGQWQTWGGVNNTDYLLISRHATGVALLPVDPPVVRISANVILPQTTSITSADAEAVRNAVKYGWFKPNTTTPWFDIPKWVFSGTSSASPLAGFSLNCANVTRNIYGLCAGDVNGSFIPPNGFKQAEPSLDLIHNGSLPLTDEIVFPIKAMENFEIGAVTLMLNFDPQLIEITGVSMVDNAGEEPFFLVNGNQLYIGWMSLNPIHVIKDQALILVHTRLIKYDSPIRFQLDPNPVSELADGEGNVLRDVSLSMADAGNEQGTVESSTISVYPNPAKEILNIEGIFGTGEEYSLEISDMNGKIMVSRLLPSSINMYHKTSLDVSKLPAGVYLLRITSGDLTTIRKILISK